MVNIYNPETCVNSTNGQGPVCSGGSGTFGCQCNSDPISLCPNFPTNASTAVSGGSNITNTTGNSGQLNNTNSSVSNNAHETNPIWQKFIRWIKQLFGSDSI